MKILYHHRIASKDGQYVHVEELTKALKSLGHEIIMVSPTVAKNEDFGSEGGIVKKLKKHMPKVVYELLELSYSFHAYRKLAAAIKKHKPDVIYERYNLYLPSGIWIKKKYKLPFLLEVNAPIYDERNKYDGIGLKRLAKWTERYVWQNADVVLPVTNVLANIIQKDGVPIERMHVIHNGIDKNKFSNKIETSEAKKRLGIKEEIVLGFTGFVRDWHGLDRVVDLLANDQHETRHLLIVGDGPATASILDRAKVKGVENCVTITGIVGRDQVADYVAAFDIALQPDVVDYASPLKMFEYLALGRAIVAPNKDNILEILTHEDNALLFDNDDNNSFYEAIERLCQDDDLRRHISKRAKETIDEKNYTWVNNAKRVISLFEKC